jgi:hypothetical protein
MYPGRRSCLLIHLVPSSLLSATMSICVCGSSTRYTHGSRTRLRNVFINAHFDGHRAMKLTRHGEEMYEG